MVTPPALIAATPVGATTAICFGLVFADVFQKGGFARTCFTGEKDIAAALIDQVNSQVENCIACIGSDSCHGNLFFATNYTNVTNKR